MDLVYHGGACCGIKTICDFPYDPGGPDETVDALEKLKFDWMTPTKPGDRWFTPAAPEETATKRLDRYIEYCRNQTPGCLIEAVVAVNNGEDDMCCQRFWFEPLLARGFVEVNKFLNSNSDNIVHVFHLVIDDYNPDTY